MYEHPTEVGLVPVGRHREITPATVDVVFFHGLTGHAHDTWLNPNTQFQWPERLAASDPDVRVWAVHYPAALFDKWAYLAKAQEGSGDVAIRLAQAIRQQSAKRLLAVEGPPCVFVCHSLGGIVAKRLLLDADRFEQKGQKGQESFFTKQLKGILFLGTPHRGSSLATFGKWIEDGVKKGGKALITVLSALDAVAPGSRLAVGFAAALGPATTVLADELKRGNDELQNLHEDFALLYQSRWEAGAPLHVMAGVETRSPVGLPDVLVVDGVSADPRLKVGAHSDAAPPLRINLTHSDLCKPKDDSSEVYGWCLHLIDQARDGQGFYSTPSADPSELLIWHVKWLMHRALVRNVRLRNAWAATHGDCNLAPGSGLDVRVAAQVVRWTGSGQLDDVSAGIRELTQLLQDLHPYCVAEPRDKRAILDGISDLVGLLVVVLGCHGQSGDSIVQDTWVAQRAGIQPLLNEASAAGHKGRAAKVRGGWSEAGFTPPSGHWASSELCHDPRDGKVVENLQRSVLNHVEWSGESGLPITLAQLGGQVVIALDEEDRLTLREHVLDMAERGLGIVIDDTRDHLFASSDDLLRAFRASPLAELLTILKARDHDTQLDVQCGAKLRAAMTQFRNTLKDWQ